MAWLGEARYSAEAAPGGGEFLAVTVPVLGTQEYVCSIWLVVTPSPSFNEVLTVKVPAGQKSSELQLNAI